MKIENGRKMEDVMKKKQGTAKGLGLTWHQASALVSNGFLEPLPRERKRQQQYAVLKPLPTADEITALTNAKYTQTIEALMSDAQVDLESLKEELQDWYDNMPENFQNGNKGEEVQSAIDELESANFPEEIPAVVQERKVVFLPSQHLDSRSDRCSEAASMLETIIDALDNDEDEKNDNISSFRDELQGVVDVCQSVSFPGMY